MIKLFDGWLIKADESSYMMQQQRIGKDQKTGEDKETLSPPKYYGSIEQCANTLCRTLQRQAVAENNYTVPEAVEALNKIRETVQTAFDGIDKIKV